jgi:hypothetical protein
MHGSVNAPEEVAEHPNALVTVTSPTDTGVPAAIPLAQTGCVKPDTLAVIEFAEVTVKLAVAFPIVTVVMLAKLPPVMVTDPPEPLPGLTEVMNGPAFFTM